MLGKPTSVLRAAAATHARGHGLRSARPPLRRAAVRMRTICRTLRCQWSAQASAIWRRANGIIHTQANFQCRQVFFLKLVVHLHCMLCMHYVPITAELYFGVRATRLCATGCFVAAATCVNVVFTGQTLLAFYCNTVDLANERLMDPRSPARICKSPLKKRPPPTLRDTFFLLSTHQGCVPKCTYAAQARTRCELGGASPSADRGHQVLSQASSTYTARWSVRFNSNRPCHRRYG